MSHESNYTTKSFVDVILVPNSSVERLGLWLSGLIIELRLPLLKFAIRNHTLAAITLYLKIVAIEFALSVSNQLYSRHRRILYY